MSRVHKRQRTALQRYTRGEVSERLSAEDRQQYDELLDALSVAEHEPMPVTGILGDKLRQLLYLHTNATTINTFKPVQPSTQAQSSLLQLGDIYCCTYSVFCRS